MKFLNWLGIDADDLERLPEEIGRDWYPTLIFIGGITLLILAARNGA